MMSSITTCNGTGYVKSAPRKSKLLPGAKVKRVQLTPKTNYLPTRRGLMRHNTISIVRNTPINYSTTGDFIISKATKVSVEDSVLHEPFHRRNIVVHIKGIKMW